MSISTLDPNGPAAESCRVCEEAKERREEKRGKGGVGGQGLRLGEPWGAAFRRVAGVEVVEWSSSSDYAGLETRSDRC